MGNTNYSNREKLLTSIEANIADEQPKVQWAMNYTAGQIGKWQEEIVPDVFSLGTKTGLYKDKIVKKNCTPGHLPEFIRIEAVKVANRQIKILEI